MYEERTRGVRLTIAPPRQIGEVNLSPVGSLDITASRDVVR